MLPSLAGRQTVEERETVVNRRAAALGFLLFGALLALGPAPSCRPSGAALDAIFAEWDREDSPGCAAGALRDGEFVFRGAYGMANLEHGAPLTADSVFRMASVSKQFTAAAVLRAEDRGLLSLEDPIRRHLPELPAWAEPVRIRHLIHHTSGIRDYLVVMALAGRGDDAHYTDEDVLAALRRLERLNFEPGTEYLYSNSGYWLLGQLIERVSGKTLREFAAEQLFGPLGMEATHFHDRHRELVPGRATGYRPRPEAEGGGFERNQTTLEMVGDGGLYTSVRDLRHWERMFLDPDFLGPRFAERLVEPGRLADGSPQDYAGGLSLGEYRGLRTVSHGGGFVGFRTYSLRLPDFRFAVFVLCNAANADPGALARRVADHFLAPAPPSRARPAAPDPPAADPAHETAILPGRFWEPASASLASIEARRDEAPGVGFSLVRGGVRLPLRSEGGALTATSGDALLRLTAREDGFVLRQRGQRDFRYLRVSPRAPSPDARSRLLGSYTSRELGVTYEVARAEDGPGLILAGAGGRRRLEPVFVDAGQGADEPPILVYEWDLGTVHFLSEPEPGDGPAPGFELSAGRARGFRFTRSAPPSPGDAAAVRLRRGR